MANPLSFWRDNLKHYLVKAKMDTDSIDCVLNRFDRSLQTSGANVEQVFCGLMEAYANANTETVHQALQRQLTELNSKTKIDANPVTRIRKKIADFNRNVGKMDCTISLSDVERNNLAQHQLDGLRSVDQLKAMVRLETPEIFKDHSQEFEAKASYQKKQVQLGCTVKF